MIELPTVGAGLLDETVQDGGCGAAACHVTVMLAGAEGPPEFEAVTEMLLDVAVADVVVQVAEVDEQLVHA